MSLYSVGFKPTDQCLRQGFELKGQGLMGVLQPVQAVSYGLPCVPPALSDFCGKKRDAFQCKKNSPINEQTQHHKIHCQRTGNLKPRGQEVSMIFQKSPDNYIDTEGHGAGFIFYHSFVSLSTVKYCGTSSPFSS